jgi:hypothetical protein
MLLIIRKIAPCTWENKKAGHNGRLRRFLSNPAKEIRRKRLGDLVLPLYFRFSPFTKGELEGVNWKKNPTQPPLSKGRSNFHFSP